MHACVEASFSAPAQTGSLVACTIAFKDAYCHRAFATMRHDPIPLQMSGMYTDGRGIHGNPREEHNNAKQRNTQRAPRCRNTARILGALAASSALASFRSDAVARASCAARDSLGEHEADLAGNEDYWSQIARCFDAERTIINLNNGGVSPAPTHVLEQMIRDLRFCNELPAHHMWQVLEPRLETVGRQLARQFGCDPEELAITRNASEGMETLILGFELKRGDEVIVTDQNYPRMLTAWDQRARRDGIVVKRVSFPVPLASPAEFVHRISRAITPATRAIEFPHITNTTGQILPVRDVVRLAAPARHSRIRRRRPFVRPFPLHSRRARLRLLRNQPAQMAAGPHRHRVPLHPQGPPEVDLAAHGSTSSYG